MSAALLVDPGVHESGPRTNIRVNTLTGDVSQQ